MYLNNTVIFDLSTKCFCNCMRPTFLFKCCFFYIFKHISIWFHLTFSEIRFLTCVENVFCKMKVVYGRGASVVNIFVSKDVLVSSTLSMLDYFYIRCIPQLIPRSPHFVLHSQFQ